MDTIKNRPTEFLPVARKTLVRRIVPSPQMSSECVERFNNDVIPLIEREAKAAAEKAKLLEIACAPLSEILASDKRAVSARQELHRLANDAALAKMARFQKNAFPDRLITLNFVSNAGFHIAVAPYDVEWVSGHGTANKNDGTFSAHAGGTGNNFDGLSAAGVGLFLESDAPVASLVRISPVGPFDYYWWNGPVSGHGSSSSATTGGLGILAYEGNQSQPFRIDQARLWGESRIYPDVTVWNSGVRTQSGIHTLGYPVIGSDDVYHDGGGFISAAVRERDVKQTDFLLPIAPGQTYLVWIWCWVSAYAHANGVIDRTEGGINCSVPFVVADSSPAPIVR